MSDAPKSSPTVPVLVALIGVAGSVVVAWITSRAKFDGELRDRQSEVAEVRRELDAKIAQVDDRIRKLDAQIELAERVGAKLTKGAGALRDAVAGGDKQK